MFRLVYQDKVLGSSKLDSGDPSIGCVSGELVEAGTTAELSQWILSEGGAEEEGAFLLELDKRFLVLLDEATPLPFAEGSVICVPSGDEIYIELTGIPEPEYAHFFPAHLASYSEQSE